MHRRPGPERDIPLRGLSTHQDSDPRTGEQGTVRYHADLRLSDNLQFKFQRYAGLTLDGASDFPDQVEHIPSTGFSPVDHEVRMLDRDFDVSNPRALETNGLDEPASRILWRILEHTAGGRHRERLCIAPVVKVVLHD